MGGSSDHKPILSLPSYRIAMRCMRLLMCSTQAQQHRITELEQQLEEANERLTVVEHACLESQQHASELRNELENNAGALLVVWELNRGI